MGKNYKETRERLRRLLNKKKTKRRAAVANSSNDKSEKPIIATAAPLPEPTASSQLDNLNTEQSKKNESRKLDELLDFIEGIEIKSTNEKKAAKRARQKEKKQMLLLQLKREQEEKARRLEEERLRQEREAEMLENLRKAAAKRRRRKKKTNVGLVETGGSGGQQKRNNNNNNNRVPVVSTSSGGNPGAQMVTIKRVMEPHDSEPTVTITLRGATPKQDKVLYTLFNGKVCESLKLPKPPKNQKDPKNIKETDKIPIPPKRVVPSKCQPTPMAVDQTIPKDINYHPINPRPTKELTNPTSIQISNAVTSMTRNGYHDFNFDGIRLPPGITITKVDPCTTKIRASAKMAQDLKNQVSLKPVVKPTKRTPTPEVIIVSTNKIKQEAQAQAQLAQQSLKSDFDKLPPRAGPSKKQKKKKDSAQVGQPNRTKMPASSYPGLDIEIIKSAAGESTADICNRMSVLTINPYTDNKEAIDAAQTPKTAKKKRKKRRKATRTETGGEATEDWNSCLDNVFAPKDLDLNDGEMDDAERELEAFKLFCMQSVPLKRKEKVNLNLKDLVLKKKSVSCS